MTMKSRAYRLAIPTAVLLVAVLLAGCATSSGGSAATARGQAMANANDLPEWYLNPQSVYPNEVFLTAVGTGDTRRDAEQQALAGLSQIFEAQVQVDARTSERYSEIMSAQGTVSENEVRLAQNTNVRSNQTLLNVQFGEAAVDETARVHVIAYIERIPTGRVYMDLIETNGDQVERFLDEASRSNGMVREYSYVSAAAVVASANRVLQDQLRIIAPASARSLRYRTTTTTCSSAGPTSPRRCASPSRLTATRKDGSAASCVRLSARNAFPWGTTIRCSGSPVGRLSPTERSTTTSFQSGGT
jgi:predicted small secreted protein